MGITSVRCRTLAGQPAPPRLADEDSDYRLKDPKLDPHSIWFLDPRLPVLGGALAFLLAVVPVFFETDCARDAAG
jgi:hypothetical protein